MSENTDYETELANLGGDDTESASINLGDLALPTLSLSDEDLDASAATEYRTIPQWTKLEVMVYDIEFDPTNPTTIKRSKNGNLMWPVTFQTVVDTWGPKKRMNTRITFAPTNKFIWGPFMKAVGLVTRSGEVGPEAFARVNEAKGKIISAQVVGHSWKDPKTGDYKSSAGKKALRSKYPTQAEIDKHGIRLFEELGNFSAYDPEAADAREDAEEGMDPLDGLAEFSGGDDYL